MLFKDFIDAKFFSKKRTNGQVFMLDRIADIDSLKEQGLAADPPSLKAMARQAHPSTISRTYGAGSRWTQTGSFFSLDILKTNAKLEAYSGTYSTFKLVRTMETSIGRI